MNYKHLYKKHNGPIPKDENGRSYEIHHRDGDHANNVIENLIAIPIQEHYDIHFAQGDFMACFLIAERMNLSPDERSKLSSLAAKKRVENGTHNFIGLNEKRMANGSHNFLRPNWHKEKAKIRVKRGHHHFLDKDYQKKTSERMKKNSPLHGGDIQRQWHKELKDKGQHLSQIKITCPHCNFSGKGLVMKRWHFENCKERSQCSRIVLK